MRYLPANVAAGVALAGGLLVGCGSDDPRTHTVTAVDFGYDGIPDTISAGDRFELRNESDTEIHELVAFRIADDILLHATRGISDLITVPGLINLDFADVRTIMSNAGSALMGIGTGSGENRSSEAARAAISSPLLEASIEGAKGILLNISGGTDLGLFEVNEAAEIIASVADPDANIIFGAVIDDSLGDELKVTVIATGFEFGTIPSKPGRRAVKAETPPEKTMVFESEELDIPVFLRNK